MITKTKVEQLQSEIERLILKAESGEQWAEICRLEAEMVTALCEQLNVPYTIKEQRP